MKKFFYSPAFVLMMLAGCQNELNVNEPPVVDDVLRLITRTMDMPGLSSNQWTNGDKIGMIFSEEESEEKMNLIYNWSDIGWTLDDETPLDKTKLKNGMKILAITPFKGKFDDISFTLPTIENENINDQSSQELQKNCELLVAENIFSLYSDVVNLNFKHKLAKLILKFDYQYEGFFVEGLPENVILYDMPKSYTFTDGVWTASKDLVSIKPFLQDCNTAVAYVIPHTIKAHNEFITLLLPLKNDADQTTTRTHMVSLNEDLQLESGKVHEISITIK